jgi:uncharacterized circularly permuted ATP-grasp superfamily protein
MSDALILQEAIRTWHDLLTNRLAKVTWEHLIEQQKQRGLFFGDRPICTVLRPRFLTAGQYRFLQDRIRLLLAAFDKAYRLAMVDKPFRDQFALFDWEESLLEIDPGYREYGPLGRLDAFFITDSNTLLFTEYNAEVPAAAAYNDVLAQAFISTPVMRKFMRQYSVRPVNTSPATLQTMLELYYQWPWRTDPPRFAILDWKEVPTYSEFVLFDKFFRENGVESRIVDPREVEYRDGKLMAGDYHITLIYKRVLIDELVNRMGLNNPVIQAVRDHAVCMVNPFRCKILYKKAAFAVLSDEENTIYFSEAEREVIDAHIPWTRLLRERTTFYRGEKVDLVPFVIENKDRFVLKPNDDYGGRGIVLGWEVDSEKWAASVQNALKWPYVVQERIILPTEAYPDYIDGRVQFIDRQLDTAPFVFYGEFMEGCLTRLSTESLLNVTAGGGSTVPTLIIEKRY